jgi:aminoglycoside phosphotransferase (APT) family kinase protein
MSNSTHQSKYAEEEEEEMLKVCPNDCKRSDGSRCSTIKYEQEPYTTFIPKAQQLFVGMFPERRNDTFTVKRMYGGGFNRIMGLVITPPKPSKYTLPWLQRGIKSLYSSCTRTDTVSAKPSKYILRAPRVPGEAVGMEYDVAAIQYAHRALNLPIPKVVSYDSGSENKLGQQYMVQEWLPGQNADQVWKDVNLTIQQRKHLVREIIHVSRSLQAITSDCAGTIKPSTHMASRSLPALEKFALSRNHPKSHIPAVAQTTLEFLLDIITRREQREKIDDNFVLPQWSTIRKLFVHLHTRGFIPDEDKFYFCHLDLFGRNILVSPGRDTLAVTGIVDWDSNYAKFCPKFMAYRAPFWTWAENEYDGENEEFCDFEPEDEQAKVLKRYWESLAGEEWCKYAFAKEYQLARRAFELLQDDNWSNTEYESILAGWTKLYPEDNLEMEFNDSDDE